MPMIRVTALLLTVLMTSAAHAQSAQPAAGKRDGEVRLISGSQMAWNAETRQWVGLETFWEQYADRHGGLKWGRTAVWPPYEQLRERDLMIIELAQGPCMMEFWHERWRLANDVRRWDPAFNEFGGCPHIFD